MKKLMLTCACLVSFCTLVNADPPKSVDIKIDQDKIEITAIHGTRNALVHYISNIDVMVNEKKMIEQKFIRQKDTAAQSAVYLYPGLKKGDTVQAEATCNKFGSLKKEVVVE